MFLINFKKVKYNINIQLLSLGLKLIPKLLKVSY